VNGYQGPKEVRFSKQTGYSSTGGASNPAQASYANGDGTGPCQACHTRTKSPDGNPRYQAVAGAGDNHYSDEKCTKCHGHQTGFDGDQAGQCKTCHLKPQVDTDSYAWDGTPAIINETEWNAYGHGATANYPSGNGPARFSAQGNTVGDVGCLYCHTSSGRHGDLKNYFRLANTTTAFGPNGTCLVCHDKKTGTTYDPDGAGTNYAPLGSAVRVPAGHDGHPSVDDTGGTFCWDCHDPHGDAGATSWYMLQAQLVQSSIAAGPSAPATYADNWGLPNAAAGAKEFATITGFSAGLGGDTGKIDYPDYYIGGLCRNCHDTENVTAGTGTKFYSKTANVGYGTASTNHPVSPTDDTVRSRCTDCHIHKIGCGGCHNAPPPSGVHSSHNQIPAADQLDIDYRKLAPETTEALYGIRCAKCHNGTHSNQVSDSTRGTSTNPYTAELMWDSTVDPKTNGATYAPAGTQAPGSPYLGGESNPTKYWGWSEGTCRSEYCHSNGTPADSAVAYKDPVWKTGGGQPAWNCVSCHGDAAATATMSKAHALHAGTAAYAYGCEKCHLSVASSATALNTTYTGGGKKLHVNGLKDVKFDAYNGNTAGTYDGTGKTCSNTYCHSNGTDRTTADGTASGPSVAWTSTGTSTCTYCHGGDATTGTNVIAGAAKGGTAAHGKHVNNATLIGVNVGCASCHSATVSSNTTISGRANHVNADPNVSLASITRPSGGTARSNGTPTGTSPATTCASAWCHSSGQETPSYASVAWNATWTAPICNKCHGRTSSLAGEPDYATGGTNYNSHTAKHIPAASAAAACVRCHATTVTTAGTAILTTTPSMHLNGDRDVSFANVGSNAGGGATPYTSTTRACQAYCHSSAGPWNGTAYAAPTFASPTWGGTAPSCTGCHGGAGAATTMSGPHAKHVNSNAAGGYGFACSKCHYGTTQDGTTILASSTLHVNGTKTDVVFNTADPFTPAGSTWGGGATATTHTCASTYCHGNMTGGINATPSWTPGTLACTACHGVPPSNHAPGDTDCNSCHPGYSSTAVIVATHVNGTVDGGGGGTSCHNSVKDDAASPGSARRAVMTDFSRPSHHAGNGDAKRGGTLTDNDCAVCHAEAAVPSAQGGKIATGPLHKNGMVDLRDADNNANYFQYDKRALCVAAGGTTTTCDTAATAAAPTPWGATVAQAFHSGTAKFRQETSGRTDDAVGTANVACTADYSGVAQGAGCSKGLDRFCLSCHDANGASAAYVAGDAGATAGNPFKDTSITNEYDQLARPSRTGAPDAAGSVVDIASKIAGALTNGQYSRHAVRGQSTSRYLSYSTGRTIYNRGGTVTDGSGFVQRGTDASARPNWNDQSVMSCSDCHAVDGANGTNGNGHGATSEYMLKDGSGGATEGTLASLTYVCYRCHPSTRYNDTATHTGNSGDWIDSTAAAGSARVSGVKGNWQAMACGNCHGAMLSDTAPDFGGIHGTSSTFTNGAGGTRQAYRFTNGASLRFYDPGVWDTTAQNCYTLSTADTYGGCTQHGRNAGTKSKLFTRPLNY
jgi:predicted CxxxxCH...CXXCH cytochrome family protein